MWALTVPRLYLNFAGRFIYSPVRGFRNRHEPQRGERFGFHLLHAAFFLSVPAYPRRRWLTLGAAAILVVGLIAERRSRSAAR
jgi:hypothetical protein